MGPGGLHDGGRYQNCTGGAAGYIDRVVIGADRIYGNPTPKVYNVYVFVYMYVSVCLLVVFFC